MRTYKVVRGLAVYTYDNNSRTKIWAVANTNGAKFEHGLEFKQGWTQTNHVWRANEASNTVIVATPVPPEIIPGKIHPVWVGYDLDTMDIEAICWYDNKKIAQNYFRHISQWKNVRIQFGDSPFSKLFG